MKSTYIILLTILASFLMASTANLEYFVAEISQESQNEIHLEWKMSGDNAIEYYEVKRRMPHDNTFVRITDVSILPSHVSNRTYTYVDRNVFKGSGNSETVMYELTARTTTGNTISLGVTEINYTSSGVRRTWGSIKSMFQ